MFSALPTTFWLVSLTELWPLLNHPIPAPDEWLYLFCGTQTIRFLEKSIFVSPCNASKWVLKCWVLWSEDHTKITLQISYYIAVCCVNTVNSMWIFCMHGMPGLPATLAEIWCMHLKTLRGILFPRTQRAPCDVSSSNAWVNWRRGIVIINDLYIYIYM